MGLPRVRVELLLTGQQSADWGELFKPQCEIIKAGNFSLVLKPYGYTAIRVRAQVNQELVVSAQ